MTREIPLSRGLVALVDDEDYDRVMAVGKWYADPSCQTHYARKNFWTGSGYTSLKMHTLVTGWDFVDHINGNGLDNRRSNLRRATERTNTFNRARRSDNTSGFKGVSWNPTRQQFGAVIQKDGKRTFLGYHTRAEDAAMAYDNAATELFGEFARLNFPTTTEETA